MKKLILFLPLLLTACAAPLSTTPDATINQMSLEDVCDAGSFNDEMTLAEQIANRRNQSCDPAKQLCFEAGLKPSSQKWPECFINAKGVVAQQEAAKAARAGALAAMQANIQNNINATRPRTCYGTGNAVTCY